MGRSPCVGCRELIAVRLSTFSLWSKLGRVISVDLRFVIADYDFVGMNVSFIAELSFGNDAGECSACKVGHHLRPVHSRDRLSMSGRRHPNHRLERKGLLMRRRRESRCYLRMLDLI